MQAWIIPICENCHYLQRFTVPRNANDVVENIIDEVSYDSDCDERMPSVTNDVQVRLLRELIIYDHFVEVAISS